jgi:hypothetical protein
MKKVLVSTAALLLTLVITGATEAAERGRPHGGSYRRQPSTRQTGGRPSTDGGRSRDAYSGTYPGRSGFVPPSTRGDDKGKRPTTHPGQIKGSGQDEHHGKKEKDSKNLEDLKKGRLARKDANHKAKQNRNKMTMNMANPGGTRAAGDTSGGQSGGGQSGGSGSPTGSGDSGSASNGGDTGSPVSSANLVVADNSGGAAGPRGPADASGPGNSSSSKDYQEQGGRQEQEGSAGRETSGSEQTTARKAPVDSEQGGSKTPSKDGSRES